MTIPMPAAVDLSTLDGVVGVAVDDKLFFVDPRAVKVCFARSAILPLKKRRTTCADMLTIDKH